MHDMFFFSFLRHLLNKWKYIQAAAILQMKNVQPEWYMEDI